MNIEFTKMHGCGNDFMLINGCNYSTPFVLDEESIRRWADRRTGIGFDQLLMIDNPSQPSVDFDYRVYNADGSEAAQCGNGARCVVRFVSEKGLTDKKTIRLRTVERIIETTVQDDNSIAVDMGSAVFNPELIPFNPTGLFAVGEQIEKKMYTVKSSALEICFGTVSFGNPHAVIKVKDIDTVAIAEMGVALQKHRCFPAGVNASFVEVRDDVLHARVYERGVGETLSCGSGACAIAVIAHVQGWIPQTPDLVSVQLAGGLLKVRFERDRVKLIGPAKSVFEGLIKT